MKENISISFCMLLRICCTMLYVMDLKKKSMVSSLEELYPGLDLDDATLCK